jgi:hypothetical protein
MAYLPTSRQKLSPLIEYYYEADEMSDSSLSLSIGSPVEDEMASSRIQFEMDKKASTELLKGIAYGIIFGFCIGLAVSKKLFK